MRGTTKPVALIVTLSLTLALALVATQGSFGADTTAELTTVLSTATRTTAGIEFTADPFSLGIELFGTWFTI